MYPEIDADIIIIGGGISGLSAALKLQEKISTLNFFIIELNDIGGRLTSQIINNDDDDKIISLSTFRISPLQSELIELIDKLQLNLIKKQYDKNHFIIFDYNGRISKRTNQYGCNFCQEFNRAELRNFLRKINKLTFTKTIDTELSKLTMQEFIDNNLKTETDRMIINHMIWQFCGVSPSEITVEFYVFLCRSCAGIEYQIILNETPYYIQEGTHEICNRIANILNPNQIIQHEQVEKIENNLRFVKITTNKSTYYCYYVIVAISPKSLTTIQFEPTIEKLKICENLSCGRLQQFVAIYNEAFWLEQNLSGEIYIFNNFPLIYCYDATINNNYPTLSGYFVQDSNSNDVKTLILAQLSVYFGRQILTPIEFRQSSWNTGSPINCFGKVEDVLMLQEKTDRIIWCGCETSLQWYGQLSGGILSGYRAAIEVLYDLRPACLNLQEITFISQHQQQYGRKNGRSLNAIFPKPNKKCLFFLITFGLLFFVFKRWRPFF